MNYCADDSGIKIEGKNYCSTCTSIRLECCNEEVCSRKASVLSTFDDKIYAAFENESSSNFICEISVESIDELFESVTGHDKN